MSLIQSLKNININNLNVQFFEKGTFSCSFILKTTAGDLVSIGWQIEDNSEPSGIFFESYLKLLHSNKMLNAFLSPSELKQWNGILFVANQTSIWHTGYRSVNPHCPCPTSLDTFILNLKSSFPVLRGASEYSDQEINDLHAKIRSLEKIQVRLTGEIDKHKKRIKFFSTQLSNTQNQLHTLESENEFVKERWVCARMDRELFSPYYAKFVLAQLTKAQLHSLILLMSEVQTYMDPTDWFFDGLYVNYEIIRPEFIVKIPVIEQVEWSNHKIVDSRTYRYCKVSTSGQITDMSLTEVQEIPGIYLTTYMHVPNDDLVSCVTISEKFLKSFLNETK